jgi:hypothetical protein
MKKPRPTHCGIHRTALIAITDGGEKVCCPACAASLHPLTPEEIAETQRLYDKAIAEERAHERSLDWLRSTDVRGVQ